MMMFLQSALVIFVFLARLIVAIGFVVERLCREQFIDSAYAQLFQFCDCVYLNLDKMSKSNRHSELSNDVREAVSSLIYAASRCGAGDVPWLPSLGNMFKQHFGEDFERACVELRPGNNVYPQIKEYLSRELVVPDDVKLQLLNDIAKEVMIPSLGTSYHSGQKIVPEPQRARYNLYNSDFNLSPFLISIVQAVVSCSSGIIRPRLKDASVQFVLA